MSAITIVISIKISTKQATFEKNNEIRVKVASYLAEVNKAFDVLKKFLEARSKLEQIQSHIAEIVNAGGNLDFMLGSDPRKEQQELEKILNSLKVEWEEQLKVIELSSQEILLYFEEKNTEQIEEVILYAPYNLPSYSWVFNTNFPEEMLRTTLDSMCGHINIPQNIRDIRIAMRKILN